MKYILFGIKDYCRDCWHDFWYWFWDSLADFCTTRTVKCYVWQNNEGYYTKEGNLQYYLRQRKISSKIKGK